MYYHHKNKPGYQNEHGQYLLLSFVTMDGSSVGKYSR